MHIAPATRVSHPLSWLPLCVCVAIASCAVGPDYRAPVSTTPTAFANASATDAGQGADFSSWWNRFNDPVLGDLIGLAAGQNLDIVQAMARLREARATARATTGAYEPQLSAEGSASRSRSSENGEIPIGKIPGTSAFNTLYTAGFDASWEIDLFGHVRRSAEAANARTRSAAAGAAAERLSVTAEVASDYFNYRGAQQKLSILDDSIVAAEHTLALTQQRHRAGDVADIDVSRASSDLFALRAQRPPLLTSMRSAEYQLEVLLGQTPGALSQTLIAERSLPAAMDVPPVGLPSDLLRRRPDIVQAESDLHAATADVGVAVAEQFPRFSLIGSLGYQATGKNDFLASASRYWSLGPSLSVPIFQGGTLASQVDARQAARDAAVAAYRKAVLSALADTETALDRDARNRDRAAEVQSRCQAIDAILDREQQRYAAGDIALGELLDTQRQRNDAHSSLVDAIVDVNTARVSLYKALGGGWSETGEGSRPLAASADNG